MELSHVLIQERRRTGEATTVINDVGLRLASVQQYRSSAIINLFFFKLHSRAPAGTEHYVARQQVSYRFSMVTEWWVLFGNSK